VSPLEALEVNSDLIAYAQLTFAYSTETVNGVAGKRVPGVGAVTSASRTRGDLRALRITSGGRRR